MWEVKNMTVDLKKNQSYNRGTFDVARLSGS